MEDRLTNCRKRSRSFHFADDLVFDKGPDPVNRDACLDTVPLTIASNNVTLSTENANLPEAARNSQNKKFCQSAVAPHDLLHLLVARQSPNDRKIKCYGRVTSYWNWNEERPYDPKAEPWYFRVRMEDGRLEDLTMLQVQKAVELYNTGLVSTREIRTSSDGGCQMLVHGRMAKFFGPDLFFGDIVRRNGEDLYEISYDDGDFEELDAGEVKAGIQVCNEYADNTVKDLFAIYNIDPQEVKTEWAATKLVPKPLIQQCATVVKFFLFLLERQRAWLRRKHHNKEHPERWTNDSILRNYYFCNVYRQLDRGTAYFRAQILSLWVDFSKGKAKEMHAPEARLQWLIQVLWASYCYRLINKIESFQPDPESKDPNPTTSLGGIPAIDQWPSLQKLIKQARAKGRTVFTNAHQTCGFERYMEQLDKVYREPERLKAVARESEKLEDCFKAIQGHLPGCGTFMAWQIVCDLIESKCLPNKVPDKDFCMLGSGAKCGIQEIFSPGKKTSMSNQAYFSFTKLLVKHQGNIYAHMKSEGFAISFPYWRGQRLTTKEIEHALCEFSKYQRIERALKGKIHTRQRLRKSRAHLDHKALMQHCGSCTKLSGGGSAMTLCDTCNRGYCYNCDVTKRRTDSWVCRRCRSLNSHSWT